MSVWDHFAGHLLFLQTSEDDPPMKCELCNEEKSAGKIFPVDPENDISYFICDGCWLPLSIKMLQTPLNVARSQNPILRLIDPDPTPPRAPIAQTTGELQAVGFGCGVCGKDGFNSIIEVQQHYRKEHLESDES